MTTLEESMAITREQRVKLPKKVQALLAHLEGEVEYLNDRIATILATIDGAIPDREKYRNMISVNQVRSKNGEWLRITASGGGGLLVVPVASNDIEVRIDER